MVILPVKLRIGVDVGGTNTDAVILDGRRLLAATKRPTTADVTEGIVAALTAVIAEADVPRAAISRVMIGTTHFTNAVVQRRDLRRTAVIRLGAPATELLPPFVDWPNDVVAAVSGRGIIVPGGFEFDGREISAFDAASIRDAAAVLSASGVEAVAVSSVFSPVSDAHERRVAAMLADALPAVAVVCSADIGRIGLLERENAAALNAALTGLAARTTDAFIAALAEMGLHAELFLTQNDGTLMRAETARRFPVRTFASGPTNSMRGAAYLAAVQDAIVLDIGGTTTDAGALTHGFPREAGAAVAVGGVRTNFRMPDLVSIGLGGGSIVAEGGASVGPQSVGRDIHSQSRVFGGSVTTATDVAVALGRATLGESPALADDLARRAGAEIDAMLADLVDRMKTTADDLPVVLVGGGALLVGADGIAGVGSVLRPEHGGVANAIGAALAQVSGEIDRVVSLAETNRHAAIATATDQARRQAVDAGAAPDRLITVEVDEVPLAYLPGNAVRLHVKVVGDLP
ncbi:MAG TPA: hydantoinase/oxoprolinase family protein [Thermomicrobiales bacterium]|jgi:N-methylhydantoinase A/oxoprolinase/acetone carboxylase beta subunit